MVESKIAIVSGGTYGIGRAIVIALASRGYQVVGFGLNERQMGSAAENGVDGTLTELADRGLSADVLVADVSKADEVERVVQHTLDKYGRIDALVNDAAIRPYGTILETTEELWDKVFDINLKGMFLCAKAVIPHMLRQGGGAIVNIGSGSGWGRPNRLAYCASKGGVFAFSAALAADHMHDHIRVNIVVPGLTKTGMVEDNPSLLAFGARNTVAGRIVLPQDVANTVAFLLSDEAEVISGGVFTVGCFLEHAGANTQQPKAVNSISNSINQ